RNSLPSSRWFIIHSLFSSLPETRVELRVCCACTTTIATPSSNRAKTIKALILSLITTPRFWFSALAELPFVGAASGLFGCCPFAALAAGELDRARHFRRAFNRCGVGGFPTLAFTGKFEAEYRLGARHRAGDFILAQRAVVSSREFFALLFKDKG